MSNHTPGPWVFECEDFGTYGSNFWLESKSGDEIICQGETEHDGVLIKGEDFVANARLIAAAPELLDVLEETVYMRGIPDDDEDRNGYEKRLMAAIAKAKGVPKKTDKT